jgi:hypothetical protein
MRKKPCSICRKWFTPDRRVGSRQKTCSEECRKEWRRRKQTEWRENNPEYFKARWLKERSRRAAEADQAAANVIEDIKAGREPAPLKERPRPPSVIRMCGELRRIPWRAMQSEIGIEVTDSIMVVAKVMLQAVQSEKKAEVTENKREPPRLRKEVAQTQIPPVPGS